MKNILLVISGSVLWISCGSYSSGAGTCSTDLAIIKTPLTDSEMAWIPSYTKSDTLHFMVGKTTKVKWNLIKTSYLRNWDTTDNSSWGCNPSIIYTEKIKYGYLRQGTTDDWLGVSINEKVNVGIDYPHNLTIYFRGTFEFELSPTYYYSDWQKVDTMTVQGKRYQHLFYAEQFNFGTPSNNKMWYSKEYGIVKMDLDGQLWERID